MAEVARSTLLSRGREPFIMNAINAFQESKSRQMKSKADRLRNVYAKRDSRVDGAETLGPRDIHSNISPPSRPRRWITLPGDSSLRGFSSSSLFSKGCVVPHREIFNLFVAPCALAAEWLHTATTSRRAGEMFLPRSVLSFHFNAYQWQITQVSGL